MPKDWQPRQHSGMNPSNPQTGDGKTKRDIFSRVIMRFLNADGSKTKKKGKK